MLLKSRLLSLTLLLSAVFLAPSCHAQGWTASTWAGCQVHARAYVDPTVWGSSRFDMDVANSEGSPTRWDFTLDWEHATEPERYTGIRRAMPRLPYGKAKATTIRATLCRYAALEERVTFRNLDLNPPADGWGTKEGEAPRFLALKSPLTVTTTSGIQITLPAQNVRRFEELSSGYNGPAGLLFIRLQTTPNQPGVALPLSPLYRKYRKPVLIEINNADDPAHYSSDYPDNAAKIIGINVPQLGTVMHLDTLTLVIRQRINLQEVPIAVRVPIDRAATEPKAQAAGRLSGCRARGQRTQRVQA